MSYRNKAILMDSLSGLTYAEIADKYGVCAQRVGQIVKREKKMIGWRNGMTKAQVGAALYRQSPYSMRSGTPEYEYYKIDRERRADVDPI